MKKRIESLETRFEKQEKAFIERGENHKKNNEAFVELTATINKLSELNESQRQEIMVMKFSQTNFSKEIETIKSEFKEFGKEIVTELKTINETLTLQKGGKATLNWLGKLIFQLVAFSATLIAVVKFILEQN